MNPQYYRPPRRPGNQSGAFDLPSILIGVAVVAILAIGVLAAIFGVIPWAQDNSAKQDLTSINTAQGATYARDDQTYKDLAGLEAAGLISELDPTSIKVTTSDDGKGYMAVATSRTGNKFVISHDNPTPRQWNEEEASGAGSWASAVCTPGVIEVFKTNLAWMAEPGLLEAQKMMSGREYDNAMVEAWGAKEIVGYELMQKLTPVEQRTVSAVGDPMSIPLPDDVSRWTQWQSDIIAKQEVHIGQFCKTYTG